VLAYVSARNLKFTQLFSRNANTGSTWTIAVSFTSIASPTTHNYNAILLNAETLKLNYLSKKTYISGWLPGAFVPVIWTVIKWLEISVTGQYSDIQAPGKAGIH
jgi:hypothetical protein